MLVVFGGIGIVHEYLRSRKKADAMNAGSTALHLLWMFAQLSVLGFGGGKGIIPQMHADATRYGWVTSDQFSQFYTIGKLVPGPTTIFAALIGYCGDARTSVYRSGGRDDRHVRAVELIMVAFDVALGAFPGFAVALDSVARAGAGNRRPRVVERVDDRPRYDGADAAARFVADAVSLGVVAVVMLLMLRTKLSAPLLILLAGGVGVVALR